MRSRIFRAVPVLLFALSGPLLAQRPTPQPLKDGAPVTGRLPLAGAPPPTRVVVSGTPLLAQLSWDAMPNASRYAVFRSDGASPWAERTPAGFTANKFQEQLPDPRPTWQYMVVAYYADGTSGNSPTLQFLSPPMRNPAGFSVQHLGGGQVRLQWQAVPDAVSYRLDGPGLPPAGHVTSGTFHGYSAPWGAASWKVTTIYPGNIVADVISPTVSTVIRVEPAHSQQWLSKPNGLGTLIQVQTPSSTGAFDEGAPVPGGLWPAYSPDFASWLGAPHKSRSLTPAGVDWYTPAKYPPRSGPGLVWWLDSFAGFERPGGPLLWDNPNQWANEAVYGNLGDLGFGRRTDCAQGMRPPPQPAFVTVCYAAAHGYGPGEAGFGDPGIVTQPAEGEGPGYILAMMIVKDQTGSVFLAFGRRQPPNVNPGFEHIRWNTLLPTVTLDNEGAKIVPFACLSCHGGRYNPQTRKVEGAQLLPLDPGLLAFASPQARAGQQENIRRVNALIVNSDPQSAVAAYIRGMYNGAVHQPGAQAQPDYVPQGWAQQSGFYRSVVKPYCAMCHLAAQSSWNFASWQNFQGNAALIHAAVCKQKTMPHAELQFKAFWTQDTGPVYTPGLLAATLGYPSCQ